MTTHSTPPQPRTIDAGADVQPAPEVLDGELLDGPDYARRPLPAVLPPWLRSRRTAAATLRWAIRYAARHLGFHLIRAPGYALGLVWWMVRGTGRALAAGFGWVSARSEYRPVITAAREANRWDLVLELIAERRALARVRISTTAWLALSAAATTMAAVLTLGKTFQWCTAAAAALAAAWLGRPRTTAMLPPGPALPVQLELSADILTAALRAAGLVKTDAVPQLITHSASTTHSFCCSLVHQYREPLRQLRVRLVTLAGLVR
jgi:DNA segregation ATPase FtsK/SpoIIIE, S-DNA-T family